MNGFGDGVVETIVDRLGDNGEEEYWISYENLQLMSVMIPSSKKPWRSLASIAARLWSSVLCNWSWLGQTVRGRNSIVL